MNIYKLRTIIDLIRRQGKLPTDQFGQILPVDDLMGWFGLAESLNRAEQLCMKKEFDAMVEAELAVESLEQLKAIESDRS